MGSWGSGVSVGCVGGSVGAGSEADSDTELDDSEEGSEAELDDSDSTLDEVSVG